MSDIDELCARLRAPEFPSLGHEAADALASLSTENERLKARLEVSNSPYDGIACRDETIRLLEAENERLRDALREICQWADAYPIDVFPEPDWPAARDALKAAGITLDSVSASNMRHVVTGVGKIARAALSGGKE